MSDADFYIVAAQVLPVLGIIFGLALVLLPSVERQAGYTAPGSGRADRSG